VLPFENLSGDPGREYLADGLAEETIASLGQMDPERMRVVGRTSVMAYKGTTKSLATIGKELGTDYLVESSIRSEGTQLRVTSKLIRVRDQIQMWSQSYDRQPASMLGVQRELSTAIAEQIQLRLSSNRMDAVAQRHTRNAEAFDLYLRGLNFANQRTPLTTERAIDYFKRATALDPDYALAWTLLAQCHRQRILGEDAEPAEAFRSAKPPIERALLLEPDLSKARTERAFGWWLYEFDWERSAGEFHRALANNRNEARAYLGLAMLLLCTCGRVEEGLRHLRTACELDRTSPGVKVVEAHFLIERGRLEEARVRARHVLDVDSKWWLAHATMARLQFAQGRDDAGLSSLRAAARLQNASLRAKALLGVHLARVGLREEARAVLNELVSTARTRYVPPTATGAVQAALGETAAALSSLELAAAVHDHRIVCAHNDPHWQALRREPRFTALLARLQLDRYGKGCSLP